MDLFDFDGFFDLCGFSDSVPPIRFVLCTPLIYHTLMGFFCFCEEKVESVRIFNPATKEVRLLPRLKELDLLLYYECSYLLGDEPEDFDDTWCFKRVHKKLDFHFRNRRTLERD